MTSLREVYQTSRRDQQVGKLRGLPVPYDVLAACELGSLKGGVTCPNVDHVVTAKPVAHV